MLSYIKNHLTSIDGIEIYPVVSLVIFFTFFVGLGIYILRADRAKIEEIKQIPLDDND
ncbi:MAG: cbb3-type cytochrome c oxidase subunit 3 [Crocinitomix sp.]|nr:cbb3-type cytochrome c oxidase subunit 3 [Crocinitomix sp.]